MEEGSDARQDRLVLLRRLALESPRVGAVASWLEDELRLLERYPDLVDYLLDLHGRGVRVSNPHASSVAFALGITDERPDRRVDTQVAGASPDIDIDFSLEDREAAIQYVYETYGTDHAAMVCNYVRFQARSAVRDVGKALGLPPDLLDRLAKSLDHGVGAGDEVFGCSGVQVFGEDPSVNTRPPEHRPPEHRPPEHRPPEHLNTLARLCHQIDDYPRHLSIHVGGMVVTGRPLVEILPVEPARMPNRWIVGANKDDVEAAGLVKIDLLCLRAMSLVQEAQALERARGLPLDLSKIRLEDERLFRLLWRADTIGAFQVESRAQGQSLPQTKPRTFEDLVVQIAIIRPGPIVAGMVHPYIRRRLGLEPVTYPHPALEPILRDTLGIILFQEQCLQVAMAIAGFSAGQADQLRRAMGSHRSQEAMEALRAPFMEGARANGVADAVAAEVFRQLSAFASFGFCKSHSAALAQTAWETLYLKEYHPAAFYAALINSQPMGFYPKEVIVWDAWRRGVRFLPPDVNVSQVRCSLEGGAPPRCSWRPHDPDDPLWPQPQIRLGLAQVHGVGEERAKRIVAARTEGGPFRSLEEFCRRTGLHGQPVEYLVLSGAFDSPYPGVPRRRLLWDLLGRRPGPDVQTFKRSNVQTWNLELELDEEAPDLPAPSEYEQAAADHLVLGFSLDRQIVELYRSRLNALRVVRSDRLSLLPDGQRVRVAGLVVCRQRPGTAKGFVFLTLEDERGLINVVVPPAVYARERRALRDHPLVAVVGRLQKARGTTNILADRALILDPLVEPPAPVPTPRSPAGRAGAAPPAATRPEQALIRSHDFY